MMEKGSLINCGMMQMAISKKLKHRKKDGNGNLIGIWELMSDFPRKFGPWEDNFTKGLYLPGVEV
jgi:hypothetical protein